MLLPLLLLNILKYNSVQTIKVISTDPSQSLPREDGLAVISDSSIQDLDDLTICLRIVFYNFDVLRRSQVLTVFDFPLLEGFSPTYNCNEQEEEECEPWKVFGRTNLNVSEGSETVEECLHVRKLHVAVVEYHAGREKACEI